MTFCRISLTALLFLISVALARTAKFPTGTVATVRVSNTLSSGTAYKDQVWDGVLTKDIVVKGKTLARSGDPARGTVYYARASRGLHAPGEIAIRLTLINGDTVISTRVWKEGEGHTKRKTAKTGGSAGTGVAATEEKKEAIIPAESILNFMLLEVDISSAPLSPAFHSSWRQPRLAHARPG